MKLIFINELGPNYRGENIYEFIFGDSEKGVEGELWESKPANGYPQPPNLNFVSKVGTLRNDELSFSVIQKSDYFSMYDAIDDVIALAWENESDSVDFDNVRRLVFRYGEDESSVKNKLYERDYVLEFEKKVVYES
jgi:hypothetical protein